MTQGIDALRRAKNMLGSERKLADVVGVKQPSVNHILKRGKAVPAGWCLKVETATEGKITAHDLRPDLYPAPSNDAAPNNDAGAAAA